MLSQHGVISELLKKERKLFFFPLHTAIKDRSILVTGAGGSIGTELSLQLIAESPRLLILYEASEYALYQIHQQIAKYDTTKVIPILGNLSSTELLQKMLAAFQVDMIFHAAAYKHVPLVEQNPIAGIRNNVFGTKNLVEAARAAGVKEVVGVSTDKAVNPTNIMGATKRLAEYILLSGEKPYKVVRFGNVLWSNGSVLPLFYRQLTQNEQVTITHSEVTRYFMSIEEAVALILQSLAIDEKVCVLDMGEPVKIQDIACRMASLLNKVIDIRYIGLRPGEKLYEELFLGEKLAPTNHPLVQAANEPIPEFELLTAWLRQIDIFCEHFNLGQLRTFFQKIIPGYKPSCGIVDELWLEQYVYRAKETWSDCYAIPKNTY